ncbi:MAG: hypothetical protein KGI38_12555, partial [Thaumarchaeota archaeon]|nr:hypothetical protein [Nitrososphaerota archaeon]
MSTPAAAKVKDAKPLTHSGSTPDTDPVRLLTSEHLSLMMVFERIENAKWHYNPCCWNRERCETPWGKDIPIWYAHIPPDSLVQEWAGGDPAYGVFILCEKHYQALKSALESSSPPEALRRKAEERISELEGIRIHYTVKTYHKDKP